MKFTIHCLDDSAAVRRRRSLGLLALAMIAGVGSGVFFAERCDRVGLIAKETSVISVAELRSDSGSTLRAWAAEDPRAAAEWVRTRWSHDADARDAALTEVVRGAAGAGDLNVVKTLVAWLDAIEPREAYGHGRDFILGAIERGAFSNAAEFALATDGERCGDLLSLAFGEWAKRAPMTAAHAAFSTGDARLREQAWSAVVGVWALDDPARLADFARTLPMGNERRSALDEALRQWLWRDASAMTAWLDRCEPNTELDGGAEAIATFAPLAATRPDVALGWAESIVDPERRRRALQSIVKLRSHRDMDAAGGL